MTFVKGQSGNPKGRRKTGKSLTELLRASAYTVDPATGETHGQMMTRTLWKLALTDGSIDAIKIILDRVDGKVPNPPEKPVDDETILVAPDL